MALRSQAHLHRHRGSRIVTEPASEPVVISDLEDYLVASNLGQEGLKLLAAARQFIEDQTGLALITQTWRATYDRWPGQREPWWDGVRDGAITELYVPDAHAHIELPRYPLDSITSVTVYDEDSNSTSVTVADVFDVDTYSMPGRLSLKRGATWPVATRASNAIEIVYDAGYGDADDVPEPLKRAIVNMAGYLYETKGCPPGDAYVKSGAAAMAARYAAARL